MLYVHLYALYLHLQRMPDGVTKRALLFDEEQVLPFLTTNPASAGARGSAQKTLRRRTQVCR
jgi:hypothetical protein